MNDSTIAALRWLIANPDSDLRALEDKYRLNRHSLAAWLFDLGGRAALTEDRLMRAKYGLPTRKIGA